MGLRPDPENDKPVIYSHVGKPGRFHHSSMVDGGDVIGAGEWIVRKGKLWKISANSGHYQPTIDFLYRAVLQMSSAFKAIPRCFFTTALTTSGSTIRFGCSSAPPRPITGTGPILGLVQLNRGSPDWYLECQCDPNSAGRAASIRTPPEPFAHLSDIRDPVHDGGIRLAALIRTFAIMTRHRVPGTPYSIIDGS